MAKSIIEYGAKYGAPPVVETVLGVQFGAIPGFTAAHAGCFWQTALANESDDWRNATLKEAVRLEDRIENLGEGASFGRVALQLRSADESNRVQIISANQEHMIQVQDTRLIYNWRKRTEQGQYPTYDVLRPRFDIVYRRFADYVANFGFNSPEENQWEVTYDNHIPKKQLWNDMRDWSALLPSLYAPEPLEQISSGLETMSGSWTYRLRPNSGRLYVQVRHAQTPERVEVLSLELTARGPIDDKRELTLDAGLSLGHDAIVSTFDRMTSASAHQHWDRKEA
jgi:uncharacterized protein (TIGR04255 family)